MLPRALRFKRPLHRCNACNPSAIPHSPELAIVWDEEWEKHLLAAATDRVRQRVDPELFQLFDFHVVRGWPAAKVARKVGVSRPRVYFAKYKVSALVKREIQSVKEVLC